jgi:hypothetical protein
MVQFPRLDPLKNATPYQRLLKSPVKSYTLTAAQYDRVVERWPGLLATEGEGAVIGVPSLDYLEIHYAFPEVEMFRDRFGDLFNRVVEAAGAVQAPRGVRLSFRDRPNRALADTIFWALLLVEGRQWVEMNHVAVPEQAEPADTIGEGYRVREATEADREALAAIEAEASGLPRLTDAGLTGLIEDARWLRIVEDASGKAVAFVSLRRDDGGWGVIQHDPILPAVSETLRRPLLEWCIAFLRNNGGRRIRRLVYMEDTTRLALLRELGFTPGETGLDYTRSQDASEVQSKIDARQGHGTLIKFGDWR